jgi:methyl-accepting chemotaxis protein
VFSRSPLGIRQKLHLLVGVCLVCALLLAGSAIVFSTRVINGQLLAPLARLQELNSQLKEVRFRLAGVLLEQMPVQGSRNQLRETMERAPELWQGYKAQAPDLNEEARALTQEIDANLATLDRFAKTLDQSYQRGDKKALLALLEDDWPLVQQKVVKPLDKLLTVLSTTAAEETEALQSLARRFRIGVALGAIALVLLAMRLVTQIMRSLMTGLDEGISAAQALSRGDLTYRVQARQDEMGALSQALGEVSTSLVGIIGRVRSGAKAVSAASEQLSATAHGMSDGAGSQATAVEQTSASVEEISASIAQNGDNANQGDRRHGDGIRAPCERRPRGGGTDDRRHAAHRGQGRHHQRHRFPDQPAGPECRHRGRAGRRAWAWLLGGRG